MTTTTEPGAIEIVDGVAHDSLPGDVQFSTRIVPWMKLGKLVDDVVTAQEAAKLGGLDFSVRHEPVYFATKEDGKPPKFTKIEGRKAVVRNDTNDWLSITSAAYPIVQYAEAFDFMDSLSPRFVAAGALRKGRQGFMVVETDAHFTSKFLTETDPHSLYAVLRTSHDCSRAVEVMVMPLRGKCMNQLTLRSFSRTTPHRWSIVHAGDVKSKLIAASESIGHLADYARALESNAERLVNIKVSPEVACETLVRVLPDRPKRPEVVDAILAIANQRTDTVGFEGTGWGLVNAVSEYFEWDRKGGSAESRFLAALQGQTHNAINKTAGVLLSRA